MGMTPRTWGCARVVATTPIAITIAALSSALLFAGRFSATLADAMGGLPIPAGIRAPL